MVRTWSSISANPPSSVPAYSVNNSWLKKRFYDKRYLHKQVKNIASINTSWYLQCIHFCIGTQKPQRKVTASLIFLVSTFYPVHQGVRRENGEKLKCCEILSLRICIAPKSILQWSLAKQKKPTASFLLAWPVATLSHVCDVIPRSRKKYSDLSPYYCVKNECCSNPVLLWLINLDSFDEIIRQRREILVTTSEFMTVLPLANVTQLQNWQISSRAWDHPRQRQLM